MKIIKFDPKLARPINKLVKKQINRVRNKWCNKYEYIYDPQVCGISIKVFKTEAKAPFIILIKIIAPNFKACADIENNLSKDIYDCLEELKESPYNNLYEIRIEFLIEEGESINDHWWC